MTDIRVVRGAPDDVEVAALAVVLAALAAAATPRAGRARRAAGSTRPPTCAAPLPVGPHAWRTSAWPALIHPRVEPRSPSRG